MSAPFLSVVIPTRERADTLKSALQSCVTQRFADAEFIVCNNASADNTEDVVKSFGDSRIRLINPGRRVSMRENWEFALNHVSGQFVTFIGDDDALMPNALEDIAQLLKSQNVDAMKWQAPTYIWPQSGLELAGQFILMIGNRIAVVDSHAALNAVRWGYLYYHFLPMIYHGALSMRLVREIKAKSGEFFCCEIPDIYSGAAAALMTKRYVYLQRPLTISGASRHSGGSSALVSTKVQQGSPAAKYFSELNLARHPDFLELSDIPASISFSVTDALLRVRDSLGNGKLYVPIWYRLFLIMRDLSRLPEADLQAPDNPLRLYSAKRGIEWLYNFYLRILRRPSTAGGNQQPKRAFFSVDGEEFGVQEVYGASVFLGKLLSCVQLAPAESKVTTLSLLIGRLAARFSRYDTFRFFKIGILA